MTTMRWLAVSAVMLALLPAHSLAQKKFDSAEDAAGALAEAVRKESAKDVIAIVGEKARSWLLTSDAVADRAEWRIFLAAYDLRHSIEKTGENKSALTVGEDSWQFPAPLVRNKAGKWSFDADAGREEILNRRVGRNELDTIQSLLAIVDAQREYAAMDSDGNGLKDYALRFASSTGKKDGLYWETAAGEAPSPLGPLVAKAVQEGYAGKVKAGKIEPYQGYLYKMITAQGANAPGGAFDYMLNGRLFGGFAVIAYPAEYGNTGVKTFMVSHDGVVYEKDLGPSSAELARRIKRFDPDKSWKKTQ